MSGRRPPADRRSAAGGLVGPGLDVPLAVHVGAALAGALVPGAVGAGAGRVDLLTLDSAGVADRVPAWRALAAAEAARG